MPDGRYPGSDTTTEIEGTADTRPVLIPSVIVP
jgi:hypothetical protein